MNWDVAYRWGRGRETARLASEPLFQNIIGRTSVSMLIETTSLKVSILGEYMILKREGRTDTCLNSGTASSDISGEVVYIRFQFEASLIV
jgi:hypothetical protein